MISPAKSQRLPRDFFAQDTLRVARQLLGCTLVHMDKVNGRRKRLAGVITETEAYCGEQDLGCHAKAGRTKRTTVMYGPPGHAYIYFTYGNHWLFNCVTQPEGKPHAVLIRAIRPTDGLPIIASRRNRQPEKLWTNGPGKLTKAFGIDGRHNGTDLVGPKAIIFIESSVSIPDSLVNVGPRIGLYTVPEPWKSKPWRFLVSESIS